MKRLSILAFCLFTLSSCATQYIPNEIENGRLLGVMPMQYGRASYQYNVSINADRETLFRQARRYAAFHLLNPTDALGISDNILYDVIAPGGVDILQYKVRNTIQVIPGIKYAISIECYDKQYRVTLTNIKIDQIANGSYAVEMRTQFDDKARATERLKAIDEKVAGLLADLELFMEAESR